MGWEGQPPAAPVGAITATRHHSCTAVPAHAESDSGEGERRSEGEHQVCADHTLCMVHGVHGVQPPPKSHTLSATAPCWWHVNRQRGGRGRGRREGGSSFIPSPSIAHPAGTHHPSSPLLPSLPPSHLSSTPTTHTHTITSTDLAHNHLYITAPLTQPTSPHTHTHTHTNPKPHPMHVPVHRGNAAAAAAAAAAPLLVFLTTSSPCPPPPACHTCTHKQQVVHV